MDVVSACPLRVAQVTWQTHTGSWFLTLVCKATFRLEPHTSPLADPQQDPTVDDRYHPHGRGSLQAASDFAPFKASADVLLVGSAFAARKMPVRSLVARLNVGRIDKHVEVWCDRLFLRGGEVVEGRPFVTMPLVYERAAGGPLTWNPVGMRFDAEPDVYGSVPIPNLQPPGMVVTRRGETFEPAGFGPIPPTWPTRAHAARRHAASWSLASWNARPLPDDIDPACFNTAPPDQQREIIRPDEPILLENLHPEYPWLSTRLPGVRPIAVRTRSDGSREQVTLAADTLLIDTDRGLANLVFRGRVALHHPEEAGQIVVSLDGAQARISYADGALDDDDDDMTTGRVRVETARLSPAEVARVLAAKGSQLPFQAATSPWASPMGLSQKPAASPAPPGWTPEDSGTVSDWDAPPRAPLPFPSGRPIPAPPIQRIDLLTRTVALEPAEPAEPSMAFVFDPIPPANAPVEAPPVDELTPAAAEPVVEVAKGELPLTDFPLERCAALAASIDQRPSDFAAILEKGAIDANTWTQLGQHYEKAIREETARSKTALLRAYDAAYVAQLEAERGPIEIAEYAKLVVASERGHVKEAMGELSLPIAAKMRIERVWLGRIMDDAGLAKRVTATVKAARSA